MDVELARTFLAVLESGSFVEAAAQVHVTQSTVSMRIKSLESRLGSSLFHRGKAGATPTAAGQHFRRHAEALVRVWQHAKLDVGLPEGFEASLAIGGQLSLWDGYLLRWLPWMREHAPDVALKAQVGTSSELTRRLGDGTVDIAIMYTPQNRTGFAVEHLFDEELVLVSSEADPSGELTARYVLVNWGEEFQADHSLKYPQQSSPALHLDLGSLGIGFLLETRSSGYFPRRSAAPYIASGDLRIVETAPVFAYSTYVVYPSDERDETIDLALQGFRDIARSIVSARSPNRSQTAR